MRTRLILALACAIIQLSTAVRGQAEDEWRTWKSAAGTAIEAKLVSFEDGQVTLEKKDGKQLVVKPAQLSAADQEFLEAMADAEEPEEEPAAGVAGLDAEPGSVSAKIECITDPKWSYHLYLPKGFDTARKWPVCFVMDPGGGSPGTLDRYIPAADQLGVILAVSVESKNEFPDSDLAMVAMAVDVYARLPVIEELAIASGMSGGSRMAYLLAEMDENVTGVLACGSGGGVYIKEKEFRQAVVRRGTVICSVIGTNDFNRCEAVESHQGYDKNARLIWFVGNHDWAGPDLITDGLAEVYGKMLMNSKSGDLDGLREAFSKTQLAWAKERQEKKPWITYHWAEFLKGFPGDAAVQKEAGDLAATLLEAPEVVQAIAAEKAITDFADKHFSDGNTKTDSQENESRDKEALKLRAKFEGLPQAEILDRMGKPSPPP